MLRFTIRDVLWLTVVVAVALGLGLGWWRERYELLARQEEMRQWIDVVKNKAIVAEEAREAGSLQTTVYAPDYPAEP